MATWTNDENKWGNTKFSITKTATADQSNQEETENSRNTKQGNQPPWLAPRLRPWK